MNNFDILSVNTGDNDVQLVKNIFTRASIHTVFKFVKTNSEALEILKQWQVHTTIPKIVLLHLNESQKNGVDLVREIRNNPYLKSILIFVFAEINDEKDKLVSKKWNTAAYINMPDSVEKRSEVFETLFDYLNIIEFSREKV
jgi:CheY-like chemotaxis protein